MPPARLGRVKSSSGDLMVEVHAKYAGALLVQHLDADSTVEQLQVVLARGFGLDASSLKLVGLAKNGKLPAAHATLASLCLKTPVKLMVVGTPAAELRAIDERSDAHAAQDLADQIERDELERVVAHRRAEAARIDAERRAREETDAAARHAQYQQEQQQRQQQLQRQRAEEQRRARECVRVLTARSTSTAASGFGTALAAAIDETAQIVLPPSVLEEVMRKELAMPLFFRVSAAAAAAVSENDMDDGVGDHECDGCFSDRQYPIASGVAEDDNGDAAAAGPSRCASVLEFTAAERCVILPAVVLAALGVGDGDRVRVAYCQPADAPPPATFLRLRSLSAELMLLSDAERRALIEQHLRGRLLLSAGDVLSMRYGGGQRGRVFRVRVESLEPRECARIIDVDLPMELVGPAVGAAAPKPDTTASANSPAMGSIDAFGDAVDAFGALLPPAATSASSSFAASSADSPDLPNGVPQLSRQDSVVAIPWLPTILELPVSSSSSSAVSSSSYASRSTVESLARVGDTAYFCFRITAPALAQPHAAFVLKFGVHSHPPSSSSLLSQPHLAVFVSNALPTEDAGLASSSSSSSADDFGLTDPDSVASRAPLAIARHALPRASMHRWAAFAFSGSAGSNSSGSGGAMGNRIAGGSTGGGSGGGASDGLLRLAPADLSDLAPGVYVVCVQAVVDATSFAPVSIPPADPASASSSSSSQPSSALSFSAAFATSAGKQVAAPPIEFSLSLSFQVDTPPPSNSDDGADGEICPICLRRIPASALRMHSLACARSNHRCVACALVVPARDRAAHEALAHAVVTCECGLDVPLRDIPTHAASVCAVREVPCRYCPLRFAANELQQHQATCLNRAVLCHHCHAALKAYEARFHCSTVHDIPVHSVAVTRDFS